MYVPCLLLFGFIELIAFATKKFQDGYSYSKTKMEEFFRSGPFEKPAKAKENHAAVKKEDIDLIVRLSSVLLGPSGDGEAIR